jgi:Protein of unknown function (DUF499)
MGLPTVFDTCVPKPEVLAGELPDAIFAADLWAVVTGHAHQDYLDPDRFFSGTHPTDNLKVLVKDIVERLAGSEGATPIFKLETGFGGGKTHSLIACVHAAKASSQARSLLKDYSISRFPDPDATRIAAFVGEDSSPLTGAEVTVDGRTVRTYTPWGQIALMAGGAAGYERIKENDLQGGVPSRSDLSQALGDKPVLILIDELVLYMARCAAMQQDHPRSKINAQWNTFLQTLFSVADQRPRTALILTLPTEQDANRRVTAELRGHLDAILEAPEEAQRTVARKARALTPTQATERSAVLARRLFSSVDQSRAREVALAYTDYLRQQRDEGIAIEPRAFEANFEEQLRLGYPFHPEFIRLFAERLADIPEFQSTRGALRLVARTIRATWQRQNELRDAYLLQAQHVDLTQGEIRDEILSRLGKTAFAPALEADVVRSGGGTHASDAEAGWPWHAATESALVTFLHSLPDGSRGLTPSEAALALGRPAVDLGYVHRGLEETERRAWYMRRDGEHFLFRTRASTNKRWQEHRQKLLLQPAETRAVLDGWIEEVLSGFESFQPILFPVDHNSVADNQSDRLRLVIIHYDKECGAVGAGDRLNFAKTIFNVAGVNQSPRTYRNNLAFLLAECSRVEGLRDAVRDNIGWERVKADLETEQRSLAESSGQDYRALVQAARQGAAGVPAEFLALEDDKAQVAQKIGETALNVRSRMLEAYRILAFPRLGTASADTLFDVGGTGSMLECFRVDFGETADAATRRRQNARAAVAEGPILQCLRQYNKLVRQADANDPLVLDPRIVKRAPLWKQGERRLATEQVWDRLRREPELPFVLKPTDLFPTFRAGIKAHPDALWIYYRQTEKRIVTRENADGLSPLIAADQILYDPVAAVEDRIVVPLTVSPEEIWQHLWPRDGADPAPRTTGEVLLEADAQSPHFPVLPEKSVLWRGLHDGARENRWVLYLRGPNLAIGSAEVGEWPGTPRFDGQTELWTYQAALDERIYPRATGPRTETAPLTPAEIKARCWPSGADRVETEDLERNARSVWRDLTRPQLESVLAEGVSASLWCAWRHQPDETFFTGAEEPTPSIAVGSAWTLVDPDSPLAQELDALRPGRGPQPIERTGTPREAVAGIWEDLAVFPGVRLAELRIFAHSRDAFDNTLRATWADRPQGAAVTAEVEANGQREIDGRNETVSLKFNGRFEEIHGMLAPIWPFERQGSLHAMIEVRLAFHPALALGDAALDTYRTAMMNANQGEISVEAVPSRTQGQAS